MSGVSEANRIRDCAKKKSGKELDTGVNRQEYKHPGQGTN
jgi:hypothetical protein